MNGIFAACVLAWATTAMPCPAQGQSPPDLSPLAVTALVTDAAQAQQRALVHPLWAGRYRLHRVDAKEDSVRLLVETGEGNVARTVERNGHALTPDEQAAEVQRLQLLARNGLHRHGAEASDKYGEELIAAMPQAMDYAPVAGQPQLPQVADRQVVLDFQPRAAFHPATAAQALLQGVAGRVWINSRTHHLVRIDLTVLQDLNVAMGLLARVYKGGTLTYEQMPLDDEHDVYRHLHIDVRMREFMVRTVPYQLTIDTFDQQMLPAVPSLQQGVSMLLDR